MTTKTHESAQVDAVAEAAAAVFPAFAASTVAARAALLREIAAGLERERDDLVPLAQEETHLAPARLQGEIARTAYQLRAFAALIETGRHLQVVVEHVDPDHPVAGPAPDLRSMRHPLGPVAVFAASNFPFAFSVAGGDTASALAAGCPVVVKAHPGHPRLSRATAALVHRAVSESGHDSAVFAMIEGQEAGVRLLQHPAVRAGAFTGSTAGGRALFDVASGRPVPIPFFGELGSVNPVFITAEAMADRGAALAEAFVASYTLGHGQFCTKPGIVFVPRGTDFPERATSAVDGVAGGHLLNDRIRAGYDEAGELFTSVEGVDVLRPGGGGAADLRPALFRTDLSVFVAHGESLAEERFGPSALIVEYDDAAELVTAARTIEGSLTATVHGTGAEDDGLRDLVDELTWRSGRLIYNGWPTGVAVSPAMVHGGPYPATTAPSSTSVGTMAIDRFLRPVSYQNFPDALLPDAVSDERAASIPRQVDLGPLLR